jgi:hypothetical protein
MISRRSLPRGPTDDCDHLRAKSVVYLCPDGERLVLQNVSIANDFRMAIVTLTN